MAFNFPTSPSEGQEYISGGVTYVFNTPTWKVKPVAGSGGLPVYISETAPPSPAVGQTWWQPSTGKTFIWYGGEWTRLATGDI